MNNPNTIDGVIKGIGGVYTGNYTGPYWSDGKFQESVEWGDSDPQSQLDYLSRQHDSAYARYKDNKHREAADAIYNREAQKLKEKFPSLAGNLVLYGNYAGRQAEKLTKNSALGFKIGGPVGALAGAIYTAGGSIVDNMKRIDGKYNAKEMADIEKYYKTDPRKDELADKFLKSNRSKVDLPPPETKKTSSPPVVLEPKTKAQELVEKQAKHFQNYANLEKSAKKTEYKNYLLPFYVPDKIKNKYKKRIKQNKKNKIHISN